MNDHQIDKVYLNCSSNILTFLFVAFCFSFIGIACKHVDPPSAAAFNYGTHSDSARHYFIKGWHEIMDNGRWTESERSFRKALEFDPDWPLGKSLVGRITRNLEERETILAELKSMENSLSEDERLLLDVNILSLEASNNRDKGIVNTLEFNKHRRQLAEKNFGEFSRKHPRDAYFKAEYIEFLHANHGAVVALDSLRALATEDQMKLGFYISYAASLELDQGNIKEAIELSNDLKSIMLDSTYTSHLKLTAEIKIAQDSIIAAKEILEKVVKIDPNHLIAHGMLANIEKRLND